MAQRLVPSLPRIKATIGHIPQRLRAPQFLNPRARMEVLRQMVTRLVREERCEFKHNKAEECRPYMERLLQMAIHRGEKDDYTNKMIRWWLLEEDLIP
ncbi:Protein MRPL-17, partial [Aphelenchoides avenae]